MIPFTVAYKGIALPLEFPFSTPLDDLKSYLSTHPSIGVPPPNQKLLFKGKSTYPPDATLETIGLKPHAKLLLIGSSAAQISAVQEGTARQQQAAVRASSSHRRPAATSTGSRISTLTSPADPSSTYTFTTLLALPSFPDHNLAHALLTRLANDHAIKHIMSTHKWRVGTLKELHPSERTILGYNENKGQSIALRLRTNDLDGFRHYGTIRKVLLHELAHMVHSAHDAQFHAFNRQLNAECDALSNGRTVGTRGAYYNPPEEERVDEPAFQGGTFRLGGGGRRETGERESRPMREIMAEAALGRLTREEEELERGCGSGSGRT
ncbi:WLM domain-containing protein [Fimicolochytrium jonesii]|uniref:WLM domain-containing protein n=1 Tax=Fimicolochytrium jonesii TaxID=1396493 RepID=UPI0022FEB8C4|nr:WLM domain-containing protein [Fimicolochytrium jonesii]KAI8824302.1 WLM domain-containing protein [Fimicolochytrium jonesii]